MPDETPKVPPPQRSCVKPALLGCAGILLLLGVGYGVATSVASGSIERRVTRVRAGVADARAARSIERPPVTRPGAPALEGNAVDDYTAIEWVLGPRPAMTQPPKVSPASGLGRDHAKTSGVAFQLTSPEGKTLEGMLDADEPPSEAMAKTLALYGPLTRHVRDGVRRPRCDWDVDLSKGVRVELPNLLAMRSVAQYLAFEARTQPPLEAARTGLDIVAFGRDLARHETLIGAMIGVVVREIGLRVVLRAAGRDGITPDDLAEVLAALDRAEPVSLDRAMTAERLACLVELSRIAGHPVDPSQPEPEADDALAELGAARALGPIFFDREMAGYELAMDGLRDVMARPAPERAKAQDELMKGLSSYLFVNLALPNLSSAQAQVERGNVEVDLARLLVAARLHQGAAGAPPADPKELAPRLGGKVPQDPFASGAPVRMAREGDVLRAWSVGPNLTDEQGLASTKADEGDVVMSIRLAR